MSKTKPLSKLKAGQRGIVELVQTEKTFLPRFIGMGFTPKTEVLMVQNFQIGPVIVYLRDTEIALSRKVASEIRVIFKVKG